MTGNVVRFETAPGFKSRRGAPVIRSSVLGGAYLVYGFIDLEASEFGALLVEPGGRILRSWPFPDAGQTKGAKRLALLKNGNLVTNSRSNLRSVSWCGELNWTRDDRAFHHEVSFDDNNDVWVWADDGIMEVDGESGKTLRHISMRDILESNPGAHYLEIPLSLGFKYDQLRGVKIDDKAVGEFQENVIARPGPYHQNDADPLPARWAHLYPGLESGDLLLSFRHTNSLIVIDPDTYRIKWHRVGLTEL